MNTNNPKYIVMSRDQDTERNKNIRLIIFSIKGRNCVPWVRLEPRTTDLRSMILFTPLPLSASLTYLRSESTLYDHSSLIV